MGFTRSLGLSAGLLTSLIACGKGHEPAATNGDGKTDTKTVELLNVSYDPTRELYVQLDAAFAKQYQDTKHVTVTIKQSHGGSGKQARSVIDGLEADVVSLGLAGDIDAIADSGLLAKDWQTRLPDHSTPYTSTIVFLVRKGNPKGIKDWNDLVKDDVKVIASNPKTSGGARWAYLGAWGYGLKTSGTDDGAKAFVKQLYQHVPVLDSGARGSTTTFVERGQGDVLLSWENEAYLAQEQAKDAGFEIVVPPRSILAEPPVAIVDRVAAKHNTTEVAKAFLDFLYTEPAQQIIAKNHYRPRLATVKSDLPKLELFSIDDLGGWGVVQKTHFADGGVFDSIYAK